MIQKYVNKIDWVSDISKSTDWDLFSKILINWNQCLLSFETTSAATLKVRYGHKSVLLPHKHHWQNWLVYLSKLKVKKKNHLPILEIALLAM